MSLEIVLVLVLVIANGLFSMSEIAVVSARKTRLRKRAEEGSHGARIALQLANDPNDFLATVQVGITLIGILAGAFGGATIAARLKPHLDRIPWLAAHSDTISFGVVVVAITYVSLILGELVPKRLALNASERIAIAVAPSLNLLSRIGAPVVAFLSWSTEMVIRLLPVRSHPEAGVTEEDVRAMLRQATETGVFEETEHDLAQGVFRLGDAGVSELMVHRRDIVWLNLDDPPEQLAHIVSSASRSRFPVGRGSLDRVLGVVHAKDLLEIALSRRRFDVTEAIRKPLFVPETLKAIRLLERFRATGTNVALVVDEHGGIEGLVTINDLMRSIVEELPAGSGLPGRGVTETHEETLTIDGTMPIRGFKELLGLETLPREEEGGYTTAAGLVMTLLGRIPVTGDSVTLGRSRIEVVEMDGKRVKKLRISTMHDGAA